MYLKALAMLGGGDRPVAAAAVADRLRVTPVAANEMLRRLIADDLVGHEPRRGFRLTAQGREIAWDVIRRQRLWERFLVDRLELEPANAPAWACLLEHATAREVLDALDTFLGFPESSPQGQPIPRSSGDRVQSEGQSLADADPGEMVRLVAFDDDDPEVLGYLHRVGLRVGIIVRVAEIGPRRSLISLEGPDCSVVMGREIAATIRTAATTTAVVSAGGAASPSRESVGAVTPRATNGARH